MPIKVVCPGCRKSLNAPESAAGKKAKCPHCQAIVTVPKPAELESLGLEAGSFVPNAPTFLPPKPTAMSSTSAEDLLSQMQGMDLSGGGGNSLFDSPDWRPPAVAPPPPPQRRPAEADEDQADKEKPRPKPRPTAAARQARPALAMNLTGPGVLFWLFGLTLIPLMFSLLGGESDTEERLERTIASHPEFEEEITREESTLDDALAKLPGERIDGAHLSRSSWMHWLYALLASGLFLGLILSLFQRGDATLLHVAMAGVVTATAGVLSLIMFQIAAEITQYIPIGGRGLIALLVGLIQLIGFSYRCAADPSNGFWLSFFGYTCGVGLCEELIKAVPIMAGLRNYDQMDWRGACMLGLASGVGFGVAEGIMYSSQYYNGLATGGIYLVRFISCVGLHAIWAASVGILLYYHQDVLTGEMGWGDWAFLLLKVQGVSMVLHGLYDTLLKRDHAAWALLVALVSFAWLAFLMLYAASGDEEREWARARSAA